MKPNTDLKYSSQVAYQRREQATKENQADQESQVKEKLRDERDRIEKLSQKQLDAVKESLGDQIEWRNMRFYQRQSDGVAFVDVVNSETGEVVRTVPEKDFVKMQKFFSQAGLTLDING